MIKIEDIKVGKKYGFDLVQRPNYKAEYVENTVTDVFTDFDGEHYITMATPSPATGLVQFSFNRISRLVGPFNDEE